MMVGNSGKDNKAAKKMLYISIAGVLPVIIILCIYVNNQNSHLLHFMSVISSDVPALLSTKSPLLSSAMSFYVKTSPLYGVIFFVLSYKDLRLGKSLPVEKLIITLLLFSFLYFFIMFFLLFNHVDITNAGRLLQFLSRNDYLLTIFFVSVFYVCYIFTCYYFSFVYAIYVIFKEKHKINDI
ncbi:colicin immunity protein Cui [Pectobacterium carotovorum]|uniref:colicin immunity protein Cui n=1 Tax=Pectobacterium carotovorum TaxID=554 RepID=UPI00255E5929|nr:colicin immunity protein Cui [Pectobacterium carotovorum]